MLKNALSLNRLANLFYIIMKEMNEYNNNYLNLSNEQKKQKLSKILKIINICIDVIDRKAILKGISKEFVQEAKIIKKNNIKKYNDDKSMISIFDIFGWFKE
jgi:hypothetical protein